MDNNNLTDEGTMEEGEGGEGSEDKERGEGRRTH